MSNRLIPIVLTVDLEDWFHVENLRHVFPPHSWQQCELRVRRSTSILLDLFEQHGARATFFVLGWVAERCPELIREIQRRGHEIASHGYGHSLCFDLSKSQLKDDVYRSKALLEDITGAAVRGYRAPNFSITEALVDLLAEIGFEYDSSYNSLSLDSRHGKLDHGWSVSQEGQLIHANGTVELPVSNLTLGRLVLPWGGGGYFRFWPSSMFHIGVKRILRQTGRYVFYFHPWELDATQPRVDGISRLKRFRHYLNLGQTLKRMNGFLTEFHDNGFISCQDHFARNRMSGLANPVPASSSAEG